MSGRHVAWASWSEWELARTELLSSQAAQVRRGVARVQCWRSRGRIPVAIDTTASLQATVLVDTSACAARSWPAPPAGMPGEEALAHRYASAIMRFVNGISDSSQKGKVAASVAKHAQTAGLHPMLVEIRHEATHNRMPSLPALRLAASHALAWLAEYYWAAQAHYVQTCTAAVAELLAKLWRNQAQRLQLAAASQAPGAHTSSTNGIESDSDTDTDACAGAGVRAADGSDGADGAAASALELKRTQRSLLGQLRNIVPASHAADLAGMLASESHVVMPGQGTAQESAQLSAAACKASLSLLERQHKGCAMHLHRAICSWLRASKRLVLRTLAGVERDEAALRLAATQSHCHLALLQAAQDVLSELLAPEPVASLNAVALRHLQRETGPHDAAPARRLHALQRFAQAEAQQAADRGCGKEPQSDALCIAAVLVKAEAFLQLVCAFQVFEPSVLAEAFKCSSSSVQWQSMYHIGLTSTAMHSSLMGLL